MRKTFFSVNRLTIRFQFVCDFYETINHDFFENDLIAIFEKNHDFRKKIAIFGKNFD